MVYTALNISELFSHYLDNKEADGGYLIRTFDATDRLRATRLLLELVGPLANKWNKSLSKSTIVFLTR